jgi:hypothetical protein
MMTYALADLRGITLYPAKHGRVIHVAPALAHHLLKAAVVQAKFVASLFGVAA